MTRHAGTGEAAAVPGCPLNSLFQVAMFAALGWFYLTVLPGWLGLPSTDITASPLRIAESVPHLPGNSTGRGLPVTPVG